MSSNTMTIPMSTATPLDCQQAVFHTPRCMQQSSKYHRRRQYIACAGSSDRPDVRSTQQIRRGVLLGMASCLVARNAQAGFGWDGTSAALGSCAIGEEGDQCRIETIRKDQAKTKGAAYGDIVKDAGRPQQNTLGMPVAVMNDEYSKETLALVSEIEQYAGMDPYDEARPKLVPLLRKDGSTWVSKYARGGSARKLSARRFYIAVDALQGHLAANGFSPFPRNKLPVLLSNVKQARDLIAQGK